MSRNLETLGTVARTDPDAEQIFGEIMLGQTEDPYVGYHRLRDAAPALITSDGSLVLTRHADCDAALRHRGLGKGDEFGKLKPSVSEEELRPVVNRLQRSMVFSNPPDHTRLRRVVSSAFTARHVEALRSTVTTRIDDLLEALAASPGADFMTTLALPLPANVISDLLGVPESDRVTLSPKIADLTLLGEPAADAQTSARGVTAEAQLAAYFADLLAHKRANPADDLLSRLATAESEGVLDETEVLSTAVVLYMGGNKTISEQLGNGLHALFTHPDQHRRLRDNPELIPSAVNELLRYDAALPLDARMVLEPLSFTGIDLQRGQTVIAILGAANRDPARFDDPDMLDLARTDNDHLSFASGIHFCIGAHLARLEIEVFLERLLHRYTDITPAGEPRRSPSVSIRGFDRLPVTLQQ